MAYEDERMSIFFRISRLETIVGDLQKEQDLGKCTNQPMKELVELRKRNKDLKHKIECMDESSGIQQETICRLKSLLPEPCTKYKDASIKEWIAKLNEEVAEVVEAMYDLEALKNCNTITTDMLSKIKEKRNKILREFVDVSTVIRSMEYAARFTDTEIAQMQCWVNNNNRERGYMDEPERQTDSHEKREN